jgi:hypothetical protein
MDNSWHSLLVGIRKSVRYHERRAAFFARLDTANGILSLLAGTGAAATAFSGHPAAATVAGATVAVSNVCNVLVGSARMSALHRELRGRFIDLERQMVGGDESPENLRRFTEDRLRIEAEEPAVVGALDAVCYNEEARAEGNSEHTVTIGWWTRFFCQLVDYVPAVESQPT